MKLDLSPHAIRRMVEFGIGEDVVADIVSRPSIRYASRSRDHTRGDVYQSNAHPAWAVVASPPDVITILRRTVEQWQHGDTSLDVPRTDEGDWSAPLSPPAAAGPVRRRQPAELRRPLRAAVVTIDPDALAVAQQLADGDMRRLVFSPDGGSVLVLNRPRGR